VAQPLTLAERLGQGAAQQLICYLRRLDELEPGQGERLEALQEMILVSPRAQKWPMSLTMALVRSPARFGWRSPPYSPVVSLCAGPLDTGGASLAERFKGVPDSASGS
jgi:hypothetical protein